ncbi:MAG: biopolymer transporter ExbD [Deltaproteobacteria bacterium]|jgi:biopolymer transport protein TolR|nr:biopolymer transporter ExbD [Deltaproteobacteria bacterium]
MSHIDSGGARGRPVSVELNLVPFIDLMSVLITFLLITAVWTQVSMIQIGSSLYAKKDESASSPKPPPNADIALKVDVKNDGYVLTVGTQVISIPKVAASYDNSSLVAQLQRFKQLYPDKIDGIVSMSDQVPYEQLIIIMDYFLVAGFPNISIATGGPY